MLLSIYLVSFLPLLTVATLTPKSPRGAKEAKTKPDKFKSGPQSYSVFDRNLIVEKPTAKDILTNCRAYSSNTNMYNFDGLSLGYVTPWNNHGYDVAKVFGNKFTHISPVWLQVKRKGDENYEITGTHDVDNDWIADVKTSGKERGVKIVPRVLFDGWSSQDYVNLLTKDKEKEAIAQTFIANCRTYKFDGLVLEIWLQLAGRIKHDALIDLIKKLSIALKKEGLEVILVVPPKRGTDNLFDADHYSELYSYVTAFSLMTYDYSNPHRPGPNAPLFWMEESVTFLAPEKQKRDKILLGLNFYGNDYTPTGGGPIIGHEYLQRLEKLKGKLEYDTRSEENYFEIKEADGKHVIFYPTLQSINERIKLARRLGTGLSIWELGQGLDYFYDLL